MKKFTFKAALVAAVVLFGMTSLKAQVTLIYPDATPAASFATIQLAYNAIDFAVNPGAHTIQIENTYVSSGETYPITLGAKTGASAENAITIKPATGTKVAIGPANQTVIASNVSFSANASAETTIDLTDKITVGDISMITSNSYIAGLGVFATTTFKKVTSVSGNVVTVPTGTFASAQSGVKIYFGNAQTRAIRLNGAKYVTIDGVSRTDANTGLTIQNPNCIYAQTILIDGASQYNTVKNCIIRGANQSGAWNNGYNGTVYFAGATYTTITNNDVCDMNDPNIPYPISAFQMTAAGGTNNNQTITYNNIYNISNRYSGNGNYTFMQFGSDANSTNNNVSFNRFYWTAPTTYRTNSTNFFAFATIGSGNRFVGNVIGYGAADGSGKSTLTFTGTGGTTYAIGGMKNAVCKNNIVGGIDIIGTTFVGLQIAPHTSGSVTADSICYGNQIKDITVDCAANGTIYGLFVSAAPVLNVNIKNNIVKNLTISSSTATITGTIYGASMNFGALSINITTTSGSTAATLASASLISGITYTIYNNANIPNGTTFTYSGTTAITLSAAATGTASAVASTLTNVNINCIGNEVANLTAGKSGSSANNAVIGFMSGGCSNTFEKNLIYNLNVISSGTGSSVRAMRFATSKIDGITVKNNIIRIGTDVTSDATISAIINEGLSNNSHPLNIYHNSIYIGGTSLTMPSHCFNHSAGANYGSIIIKNNIFSNARTGGSAVNQIFNTMSLPVINASTNNLYKYGSLFATVTTGPATYATLSDWNTERMIASLNEDANSKDQLDPQFADATATTPDLHVPAASPANESGIALAAVTDDFAGLTRADYVTAESTNADMGAYAISNSTAVETQKQDLNVTVYGLRNNIQFVNLSGKNAAVFALSGQLLKSVKLTSDNEAVPASKGLYLVHVNGEVTKVIVQ